MQRRRLFAFAACVVAACGGETPSATEWGVPVVLDDRGAHDVAAALRVDASGNAVAAWSRRDAPGIAVARFDQATQAWGAPLQLAGGDADGASQIDLDVQAGGDAVVVWRQPSAGLQSIWSSWFDAKAGTWHDATPVERDETGDASAPSVAALPTGGAVAVWQQWDGLRETLWANHLDDARLAWTGRSLLETTDSADALEPDVATDSRGNATVVWTQSDGAFVTVWTSRRRAQRDAWGALTMLGANGFLVPGATPAPRVALDAAGNGLAIWSLTTDVASSIWASRYDGATETWQIAAPIEPEALGRASDAALALDANGDAFVAWRRSDGETFQLWASTFAARTGTWAGAVLLDVDAGIPAIAAAGDHQAVIVWQALASTELRASRFSPRTGRWKTPSLLAADTTEPQVPQVAQEAMGRAVAIYAGKQAGTQRFLAVRAGRAPSP